MNVDKHKIPATEVVRYVCVGRGCGGRGMGDKKHEIYWTVFSTWLFLTYHESISLNALKADIAVN